MTKILPYQDFSRHIHHVFLKEDHKGSFHTNKTQYDWFPGKSLKLNEVKETKNDLQLSLEEEAKNSQ